MQLSNALLFAFASLGALAAPSVDTNKVIHNEGINLRLLDETTVQRLDADGNVLDVADITADQLAEFTSMADQPLRRDENHLVQRACVIGSPCSGNADCWFQGCDGCAGYFCFGTTW